MAMNFNRPAGAPTTAVAAKPETALMEVQPYDIIADQQATQKQLAHSPEIESLTASIDVNDFNVKLRNAQKFLSEGNRCKVTVRFRGREMAHTNIGQELLLKFAQECGETAVMDKSPKLEGRHMSIFLSPKPAKKAKK